MDSADAEAAARRNSRGGRGFAGFGGGEALPFAAGLTAPNRCCMAGALTTCFLAMLIGGGREVALVDDLGQLFA